MGELMNSKNTKYGINKLENLLIDVIMSVFIVLLLLFFVKNASNQALHSNFSKEQSSKDLSNKFSQSDLEEKYVVEDLQHEKNSRPNVQNSETKEEDLKKDESDDVRATLVNINTANLEELKTLSGVGDATAKRIIAYREEHGVFKKISDLKRVSGIGEAKFNKIKNSICVE